MDKNRHGSSSKILVITDNDDLLEAMKVILGSDYQVIPRDQITNVPAKDQDVECIFFDLMMSGEKALPELKVLLAKSIKPVIAILDGSDNRTRKEVMSIGIHDYVEFPIEPDRVKMIAGKANLYQKIARHNRKKQERT